MKPQLHYYNMYEGITAFTTTRHGGFSEENYATLNINPHRGDEPEAVEKNLQAVANELGIAPDHIVRQHQVHETNFRRIEDPYFSLSDAEKEEWLEGIDGVVTDKPGTCIGVFTADCIPVILFDPVHKVIGAAHAGWRGTVKRISEKIVKYMGQCFGTAADDLIVVIGPGITFKNFEVGQEVYDTFASASFDMSLIAKKFPTMHPEVDKEASKWHIDLPGCNRLQLINSGVNPQNIHLSGIDTYDNADDYFSARRLKTGFGTMFTGLVIR